MNKKFVIAWVSILAHVIMSGAFAWIYARGNEAKPWLGQGIRLPGMSVV